MSSASTISTWIRSPGATVLKMDFLDDAAPARLVEVLGGEPDIVLSDMAAPTTGHRRTDHIRTMHLCEVAADFAISVLKPGGHFLSKTFQGGTEARAARPAEEEFPLGPPRQAAGLARRIGRALSAGQGLQGREGEPEAAAEAGACDRLPASQRWPETDAAGIPRRGRTNGSAGDTLRSAPTMTKAVAKADEPSGAPVTSAARLRGCRRRPPRRAPR